MGHCHKNLSTEKDYCEHSVVLTQSTKAVQGTAVYKCIWRDIESSYSESKRVAAMMAGTLSSGECHNVRAGVIMIVTNNIRTSFLLTFVLLDGRVLLLKWQLLVISGPMPTLLLQRK